MKKAVRAIIIHKDKFLMMHRNKSGVQYHTLVGGGVKEGEQLEAALIREVREETGLAIQPIRLVFYEELPPPHNSQYIYLCEITGGDPEAIALEKYSEEALMNQHEANIHTPVWVNVNNLHVLHFRTPALHKALLESVKKGFPVEAQRI